MLVCASGEARLGGSRFDSPPSRCRPRRLVYYPHMLLGLALIGAAAISWGTTGATMALLSRDTGISPLFVGWARLAIAAPFLLSAAAVSRLMERQHAPPRRPERRATVCAGYVALGLAMATYQVCYFRAVTLTGVGVAALLAICSAPVVIAVLAAAWLRERLGPTVRVSLVMAVVGTALLVIGPRGVGEISGGFALGAVLALGAGLSYGVYAVTAKRVLSRAAPLPVAAMTFSLGALFLTPTLLGHPVPAHDLLRAAPLLVYLGLVPTAVAYGLFTMGLARVPATRAGIVTLLEPLTAATLGVAAFGESLGIAGWAGAALLLTALALLVTTDSTTRRSRDTRDGGDFTPSSRVGR